MNNLKEIQQIQSLIAKGKDSGFLTFDEVTKALPEEMNTRFEEIIGIFEELEIVIVDSEKEGKKIAATPTEVDDDEVGNLDLVEDEESADYSSRSTDPVRMYLREMGAVPLLDRDGEVVIAKKIELGEQDVLYALVEVPVMATGVPAGEVAVASQVRATPRSARVSSSTSAPSGTVKVRAGLASP